MENIKRYYGADGNDKVLHWFLYRIVESEHIYPENEMEIIFELPGQSFDREVIERDDEWSFGVDNNGNKLYLV